MTLAVAAVAGMWFEPYKHQCRHFFEEARQLAMPALSTSYRELSALDVLWTTTKLHDLQLQVLLLEYAIWSKESELESWAFRHISLLFVLVFQSSQALPAAIVENVELNAVNKTRLDLQSTGEAPPSWASWIYDEELKRTIFALYCLSTKASHFLGHEVYVPIKVEVLRMPASDDLFNASMEADWEQCRKCESRKPDQSSLRGALLAITYLRPDYEKTYASLSPFGRHILLCGITAKATEATRQPLLYDSFDAYVASDLPSLKLKDDFLKALRAFHRFLRPNPACLSIYAPCNTMDIQSLLLVCHLEISFLYSTAEDVSEYISDNLRSAFIVALQPFSDISKHGYIEIATQGPWRLDKASYYATRIVTQVIMKWITKICALASKGRVEEADKGLYLQLTRLVMQSPGFNNAADLEINYNPATVARARYARIWIN
ncbi:uncharacterized protein BHQ10_010373 [Talaromyces amestolkiae]|uniref:Transcription factor domain-containing protein n=1 Tax=Talaromyces amestolkiae TaxID=1196081 RepID=A0A364LF96_TALAM|nr:uncharacterized protein BHQ10_010373 [Talaromyces amestolkiae]RAO74361.1 hypothetical protein BHQ10_010373 [Talaromyces amestolkiae]